MIKLLTILFFNQRKGIVIRKTLLAMIIAVLFWIFFYIGISHHEMWRDELQAWSLVKSSSSIPSLLYNMRYEGHPALWHILIYIICHFSDNPFSMALLNITISASTVFLILRYSPFALWQSILIVSGYFFSYEYAIISRNYMIEIFLLVSTCTLISKKNPNLFAISILLFLVSQCNIFGLIIASCLFLYLIYTNYPEKIEYKKLLLPGIISLAGIIVSLIQIIPPSDSGYATEWTIFSLGHGATAFSTIATSYLPIPKFEYNFWDTKIFSTLIADFLSLILLAIVSMRYISKPALLKLYLALTFTLLLFFYTKYTGSQRHQGHIFISLLICEWLNITTFKEKKLPAKKLELYNDKAFKYLFTFILLAQLYSGIYANYRDYNDTFSECKNAADYIKKNHLENLLIISQKEYIGTGISAEINKPLYSVIRNRYVTYTTWDTKISNKIDISLFFDKVKEVAKKSQKDCLIILNQPYHDYKHSDNIKFLTSYDKAIVPSENYYLYRVNYKNI